MADKNERQNWIFTFGCGQQNEGKFVKFFGTFGEAREQMCEKFGNDWAFQYSEEEWNRFVKEAEAKAEKLWGDKRFALVEKELK